MLIPWLKEYKVGIFWLEIFKWVYLMFLFVDVFLIEKNIFYWREMI